MVRLPKPATICKEDGEEIFFAQGDLGDEISLPDPDFCNLELTIAHILHASGAAEIIDEYHMMNWWQNQSPFWRINDLLSNEVDPILVYKVGLAIMFRGIKIGPVVS